MKIVIDIPEYLYKEIVNDEEYGIERMRKAVINGTPLPKGHGDLIEANENLFQSIRKWCGKDKAFEILNNAPIIIEADKEKEE